LTLDAWKLGNPETVLMHKQQAALKRTAKCGNCQHYQTIVIGKETHHGCELKRRNWQVCTFFKGSK